MALNTAVPMASMASCARTGRFASGSSVLSGSFCVATPSQSSRLAVKPMGSGVWLVNFVAPMGAIAPPSHASVGAGAVSSASRSP